MKTPKKVNGLCLVATCSSISINEWNTYMDKTTKASGTVIRGLIKKHLPELYEELRLKFYNPYEYKCVKKKGLLVYVHSSIEFFLEYY